VPDKHRHLPGQSCPACTEWDHPPDDLTWFLEPNHESNVSQESWIEGLARDVWWELRIILALPGELLRAIRWDRRFATICAVLCVVAFWVAISLLLVT